jgi:hypothetical protein
MSITGNFQVVSAINQNPNLETVFEAKRIMLQSSVALSVGGKKLSISIDNSCGAGRLHAIRSSIMLLQRDKDTNIEAVISGLVPGADAGIISHPNEQQLVDALEWLISSD